MQDFHKLNNDEASTFSALQQGVNKYHKLTEAITKERQRLAKNQQVPLDELRVLVLSAYTIGAITIGKAAQTLNVDILEFRGMYRDWLAMNPEIEAISRN